MSDVLPGPALKVERLNKRFGGVVVAKDLRLTIPRGRVTGIIGPNGAGKSTLFNIIAGFVTPDAGRIELDGRDITRLPMYRRAQSGVSRTWQHVRLFPSLSVFDNLVLGARDYKGASAVSALFRPPWVRRQMEELGARADALLVRIGLSEKRNEPTTNLSYGQQKRVGLARALMNDGSYLLLDEPLSGVDGKNYEVILDLIRQEVAAGRGICVIEHNISFMTEMANDLLFLFNGQIEAQGLPQDILADARIRRIYFGGET